VAEINAIEVTARALYDALKKTAPSAFITDFDLECPVTIDGTFNLHALATLVLINLNAQAGQIPSLLAQMPPKKS